MTPGDAAPVLAALRDSRLRVLGRFADASNLTLLAVTGGGLRCVYKPSSGERPLWDFPTGTLAGREVAMYLLATSIGWDVVPETTLRPDGPYGAGVCQRFVEPGPVAAVRVVAEDADRPAGGRVVAQGEVTGATVALVHDDAPQLRQIALLDAIANNADRKGGHVITDVRGRLWGIDHGLTFHEQDKLRSVLWGFAGEPIEEALLADLRRLDERWDSVATALGGHLAEVEVAAAHDRLEALLAHRRYPQPTAGWPRLPWPPI